MYRVENLKDKQNDRFWRPADNDKQPQIHIQLQEADLFDKLTIREHIASGQRIEGFEIQTPDKRGRWRTIYTGNTIGYQTICELGTLKAQELRILFTDFRDTPEISFLSLN